MPGTLSRHTFVRRLATLATESAANSTAPPVHHAQFFFDNVYPLKLNAFDFRSYISRLSRRSLETKLKQNKWLPPENELPYEFKIEGVVPRRKEGGMFVKFTYRVDEASKDIALKEIHETVENFVESKSIIPWFNFYPMRVFLVKGEPLLEDMAGRYPARRLRVIFEGSDVLSIDSLYHTFRRYGRIRDITVQPLSIKDTPRFAMIIFTRIRSATSAKSCVHRMVVDGTRLSAFYDRVVITNVIYKWMTAHPRISIPLIAALIAGISYIIFDPIRTFFITSKITQRFSIQEYPLYQWLRKETIDRFWAYRKNSDEDGSLHDVSMWSERVDEEMKLRSWLKEPPETFIVVLGPRGSGKSEFIDKVIQNKKNKVFIRCDHLLNSRDENELVYKLAKQVGYFPLFTIFVALSNIIDTVASATIGQKTGFTSTTDAEVKQILDVLALALHRIAPDALTKRSRRPNRSSPGLYKSSIVDTYDSDDIPILVIDSYMTKDKESHELWEHLTKLAVFLIENRVAHVIFASSNTAINKTLSKALPYKTFNHVILSDAPPEKAIKLVRRYVDFVDKRELEDSVVALGGRLTDLKMFIKKIRDGQTPQGAFRELLAKAVMEIRKLAFGDDTEDAKSIPWTGVQFWKVIVELSKCGNVDYDSIKYSPMFKGDDTPLKAMEEAELITIIQHYGYPYIIRPGKPLYQTAFSEIIADDHFAAIMELQMNQYLSAFENAKLQQYEDEMGKLAICFTKDGKRLLGSGSAAPGDRMKWLAENVGKKHVLIAEYENKVRSLKKEVADRTPTQPTF
ncbi:1634_t:CDS:10 [Paraglomus brasilianum]|uniref:Mitochondrial escape protein 2 n=1 Tax=Paraglomus brasilianum TaxID=144538 RepID=A0A9N8VJ78_9GLOM|nr:1634_t:CDS:10 [Paraglomus brasilianum]